MPEKGLVKVFAINTTLHNIKITIPPVELLEFETLPQKGEAKKVSEPECETERKRADRFSKLLKIFDFSGLNIIQLVIFFSNPTYYFSASFLGLTPRL